MLYPYTVCNYLVVSPMALEQGCKLAFIIVLHYRSWHLKGNATVHKPHVH